MSRQSLMALAVLLIVSAIFCSAQTEIQASEIIAKIQNGQPVEYSNITVVGDLNLCALSSPAVRSEFFIVNSTVYNATFDKAIFEKDVSFWGTTFKNASFNRTSFNAQADFFSATFGHAGFAEAVFSQQAVFDSASFRDSVTFSDSLFGKDASFSGAQFLNDTCFSSSKFSGPLDFSSTNFTGVADFFESQFGAASFSGSRFGGPARFGLAKFDGLSSFGQALFAKEANFILARFSDAAYFSGAHFQEKALFGLVKFEDVASFQNAAFDGELNLKAAQIYTFLLQKSSFKEESKLVLNDADFARLKAPWNEIEDHLVYDPGVYLALVDNYRGLGWHKDEDDCYYAYRSLDQAEKGTGWSKGIDVLAWISCGYGVRPSYAMAWSILTILIFAAIFWAGDGIRRSAKPLHGTPEIDSVPERASFRNALFFSTMIFLSQGPIDFLPIGRHRYYVIIEGIVGWLLLALFLVTLGRVMIR